MGVQITLIRISSIISTQVVEVAGIEPAPPDGLQLYDIIGYN